MALRQIVKEGDDILRKQSKEVVKIDDRLLTLLDDMKETLDDEQGVGLAAPQVGVLKRVFIVDVGTGLLELINPEILETSGVQDGEEGCLSVPGMSGLVERPNYVKIKALDRYGNEVIHEGTELLARAFCHEYDHLNGSLYIDKARDLREIE